MLRKDHEKISYLRMALTKALIELEYAHEKMGNDRSYTRADSICCAKRAMDWTKPEPTKLFGRV